VVNPYTFTGFLWPVDNPPVVNRVRAGLTVPLRFRLGGDRGMDIFASGSPSSQPETCDPGAPVDSVELPLLTFHSSLTYVGLTDTYIYLWKTPKAWANSCRLLTLQFADGTSHSALFSFKR
jgi:hypothetical protein